MGGTSALRHAAVPQGFHWCKKNKKKRDTMRHENVFLIPEFISLHSMLPTFRFDSSNGWNLNNINPAILLR